MQTVSTECCKTDTREQKSVSNVPGSTGESSNSNQEARKENEDRAKEMTTWLNPPNLGKQFLRIVDECFPRGHPF